MCIYMATSYYLIFPLHYLILCCVSSLYQWSSLWHWNKYGREELYTTAAVDTLCMIDYTELLYSFVCNYLSQQSRAITIYRGPDQSNHRPQ